MKIKSVRFAYSVKVGKSEITFATSSRFSLEYDLEDQVLWVKEGQDVSIVPVTNIPYMEPDLTHSNMPQKHITEPSKEQEATTPQDTVEKPLNAVKTRSRKAK